MINKINTATQNQIGFKQNLSETTQQPKSKLKEFSDYFIRDTKNSLPASAAIAVVWSLFDIRKGKGVLAKSLMTNIALFTTANIVFSAVAGLFRVNRKNPE